MEVDSSSLAFDFFGFPWEMYSIIRLSVNELVIINSHNRFARALSSRRQMHFCSAAVSAAGSGRSAAGGFWARGQGSSDAGQPSAGRAGLIEFDTGQDKALGSMGGLGGFRPSD